MAEQKEIRVHLSNPCYPCAKKIIAWQALEEGKQYAPPILGSRI